MSDSRSGIEVAVEAAGGQAALAAKLGVTQQAISVWKVRGWVPLGRAVEIEQVTGVARARLVNPRVLDLVDSATGG